MNIRYNILILSIFSLTMIAYGQTYFGIKYPEPVIQKDALDPIYGQRTLDQLRTSELIFSRLWRYNELLILEEDLLEKLPAQDKRGMLCILKVNAKWPDGTSITTDDVIFTIEAYKRNNPRGIGKQLEQIKCEIINAREFVFVPAEKEINNFDHFIYTLFPHIQILPRHILKTTSIGIHDQYVKKPIGSGAFQISNIDVSGSKVEIVFNRNPNYYFTPEVWPVMEITAVSEPSFERQVIGLLTPNEDSYKDGRKEYDLLIEDISNNMQITRLNSINYIKSTKYSRNSWTAIALNVNKPYLSSPSFRRTLDKMLNNEDFVRRFFGNDAISMAGPFLPGFGVPVGDYRDRNEPKELIIKDLDDQNFKLIDNTLYWQNPTTGKKEKVEFRLIYNKEFVRSDSREDHALQEIIRSLNAYGISIIKDGLTRNEFYKKEEDKGYWDMSFNRLIFGWRNDITPIFVEDGKYNITGYTHPELNSDIAVYKRGTPIQRREAGSRIQKHCYENVPYLFLWHVDPKIYYRDVIQNFSITPMLFFTNAAEWSVKPR